MFEIITLNIIVFSVPGAFTPTCSEKHFPGYLELIDEFKLAGIDAIACLAVNDAHVMHAWAEQQGANDLIDLFADIRFKFSDVLGITADLGPVLGITCIFTRTLPMKTWCTYLMLR